MKTNQITWDKTNAAGGAFDSGRNACQNQNGAQLDANLKAPMAGKKKGQSRDEGRVLFLVLL